LTDRHPTFAIGEILPLLVTRANIQWFNVPAGKGTLKDDASIAVNHFFNEVYYQDFDFSIRVLKMVRQ